MNILLRELACMKSRGDSSKDPLDLNHQCYLAYGMLLIPYPIMMPNCSINIKYLTYVVKLTIVDNTSQAIFSVGD
jgi:hypothetical protein